jgi:hypothetical protein
MRRRKLDQTDLAILAALPDLDLDMLYVLRNYGPATECEVIERLVQMGCGRLVAKILVKEGTP